MSRKSAVFPFSAIVGQELLKKSLMLNVVDPNIGGVLIRGTRGTAKSTAVRALAQLLPSREVSEGCPFGCGTPDEMLDCPYCSSGHSLKRIQRSMRVVELPVSATEDKVVGTLDISAAIKEGEKRFEPGILAEANGNILYADEVNLLNDHVVDVLLDVAAMGINTVEREGISYSHPSRFVLVGTMNPEEGDLRPQLLDRFGLCVNISGIDGVDQRMLIANRRRAFLKDPAAFCAEWREEDRKITASIVRAKEMLGDVVIGDDMARLAVETCVNYNVDGHRADIALLNTSAAIAALDGRLRVSRGDMDLAAVLVLAHRAKDPPQYHPPLEPDGSEDEHRNDPPPEGDGGGGGSGGPDGGADPTGATDMGAEDEFAVKGDVLTPELRIDDIVRDSSGRRRETVSDTGRYSDSRIPGDRPRSIAIDATVRMAAMHSENGILRIEPPDIREKIRMRKTGNLIVFAVDASGSMGSERRMAKVKAAVLSLLSDAYQKRDRVCLVTFRGGNAEEIVPPTNSTDLAKERMRDVAIGGRTPLSSGLELSVDIIRREVFKDRTLRPILVVVSDGRANSGLVKDDLAELCRTISRENMDIIVLDSESGFLKLGLAKTLSENLGARYLDLDGIRA